MKQFISVSAFLVLIASPADPHRAMLNMYCVTCHNDRAKTGGLSLDGVNLHSVGDDAQV
jgi:hypothetical protein